jgi:hypothetical protein
VTVDEGSSRRWGRKQSPREYSQRAMRTRVSAHGGRLGSRLGSGAGPSATRRLAECLAVTLTLAGCAASASNPQSTSNTRGKVSVAARASHNQPAWEGSGTPTGYSSHVQLVRGSKKVPLLVIPRVANWWARCTRAGHSVVSFSITDVSANVTVETGARTVGYPNPAPGHRISIAFPASPGGLGTVQIAQVGEGRPRVATVHLAAGPVPGTAFACEISAQAIVTAAGPTGG